MDGCKGWVEVAYTAPTPAPICLIMCIGTYRSSFSSMAFKDIEWGSVLYIKYSGWVGNVSVPRYRD